MDSRLFFWSLGSALILSLATIKAQPLSLEAFDAAHIITGTEQLEKLGSSVSGGGDINGDGYDDFIVGAPLESYGRAIVVDGYSGQIISEFLGPQDSEVFGDQVQHGGDIDGDGYDDILVADSRARDFGGNSGKVYVFSGQTGNQIFELSCAQEDSGRCGAALAGACDFDGDSYDDFLVGALNSSGGGEVFAYSGASGSLLFSLQAEVFADQFGGAVSCSGDVDGDGISEVLVGAWGHDTAGSQAGRAYLYSGANQELLFQWTGEVDDQFGFSAALIGDTNYDGASEVLIGAPQASGRTGYAEVFSGLTGESLLQISTFELGQNLGHSVSQIGDVDLDGAADMLVGDPSYNSGQGRVYLISGSTGELLVQYTGESVESDSQDFGLSLFAAGDANADGVPDVIIGTPNNSATKVLAGRTYLFYSPPLGDVPPPPKDDQENPPEDDAGNGEKDPDETEPEKCEEAQTPEEISGLIKKHLQNMSWDEAWKLVEVVMSTQIEEFVDRGWWSRWERSAKRQLHRLEKKRERERRREERRKKREQRRSKLWDLIFWWL